MLEIIFLFTLGLIWIVFASMQDLKKREVANWLSFSLIIFALGFRFFYSLFSADADGFNFFYYGIVGLGIFFILGNLLYYGRMFAGGDAKLIIALGSVLSFSDNLSINLKIFLWFFLVFLFIGMFYGLAWSLFLMFRHIGRFKKEFSRQLNKNKRIIHGVMLIGIVLMLFGFFSFLFFCFGILIFLFPYFYIYAKSVDEACMIKKTKTSELTEGDWLYKDVKIGKKIIKAKWDGLSNNEIKMIRKKHMAILIREGIPFVPVFLVAYLILALIWFF